MSVPSHLLDTNICSYLMRGKPAQVAERLLAMGSSRVAVSVITAIELREGVELSPQPEKFHRRIGDFLSEVKTLPLETGMAEIAARLRARLRRHGNPIGDLDTLIAAHALHLGMTLVTNNVREFARVPELTLENWAE